MQEEKQAHKGEFYRWLPSNAQNPDPEHQLLYGKIFRVGEGDKEGNMPGERYGCRCGIEWLKDEDVALKKAEKEIPANFKKHIDWFYEYATPGRNIKNLRLPFAEVSADEKAIVKKATGKDISGYKHKLTAHDVQHAIKNHGGQEEYLRGQFPISKKDILLIPYIVSRADVKKLAKYVTREKRSVLEYKKRVGKYMYTYHGAIGGKRTKEITLKTFYKGTKKG